ncbi:MAG: helix-turn-helix domain-containing protein [Candidatus Roizmanbacteria bacterium]|nr:helix-turn-helix domain-containing protein [Candidatus Roizmanbacteria bacterium]
MEFYTTRQIAKILDLKTITIRRWIDKGILPAYRFGTELRIDKTEFEKFVKERRIKP